MIEAPQWDLREVFAPFPESGRSDGSETGARALQAPAPTLGDTCRGDEELLGDACRSGVAFPLPAIASFTAPVPVPGPVVLRALPLPEEVRAPAPAGSTF